MGDPPTGAQDRASRYRYRSATYQLKVELRRLERTGQGDSIHAEALRSVLQAFAKNDSSAVLRAVEEELDRLKHDGVASEWYRDALRRAVSIYEPEECSARHLFTYYLRKMENEGRGSEPFANALRKALASDDGPTLSKLFISKDGEGHGA